jgi:hypothetical protein
MGRLRLLQPGFQAEGNRARRALGDRRDAVLPEAIRASSLCRLEKNLDLIERMPRECSNNC